jgi:hypothetical protein
MHVLARLLVLNALADEEFIRLELETLDSAHGMNAVTASVV